MMVKCIPKRIALLNPGLLLFLLGLAAACSVDKGSNSGASYRNISNVDALWQYSQDRRNKLEHRLEATIQMAAQAMQLKTDSAFKLLDMVVDTARHYGKADQEIQALLLKASLKGEAGQYEAAKTMIDSLKVRSDALGRVALSLKVNIGKANLLAKEGQHRVASEMMLEALTQVADLKDTGLMIQATIGLGTMLEHLGQSAEASHYFNDGRRLAEEANDLPWLARAHNAIGTLNVAMGDYSTSLKNYETARAIAEQIGDVQLQYYTYANMATIYGNTGHFNSCLDMLGYLKNIFERLENYRGLAAIYGNIGIILGRQGGDHLSAGNVDSAQEKFEAALQSFAKGLAMNDTIGDVLGAAGINRDMATIYTDMGLLDSAEKMDMMALPVFEEQEYIHGLASVHHSLGRIAFLREDYGKAASLYETAFAYAKQSGSWEHIRGAASPLSLTYAAMGRHDLAFEYQKLYDAYSDSINKHEATKELAQYEFRAERQQAELDRIQKENEAKVLMTKQRQQTYGLIAGLLGLLIVVVGLVSRYYLLRRKNHQIKLGQERSDQLLLNILPEEAARELKETGGTSTRHFEQASVLFADIKDFVKVAACMEPDELVKELSEFFGQFDELLDEAGVEKIKMNGDEYMCASGVPVPDAQHAENIVALGLKMQEVAAEFRKRKAASGNGFGGFHIRVGIHSGPVMGGIVGKRKFSYELWGDTVTMASKIEGQCEPDQVTISAETYALVKHRFAADPMDKPFSFKTAPIAIYAVRQAPAPASVAV